MVRIDTKVASGAFSSNLTVLSSTLLIDLMSFGKPIDCACGKPLAPATLCHGLLSLSMRSNVKTTSSAFSARVGLK